MTVIIKPILNLFNILLESGFIPESELQNTIIHLYDKHLLPRKVKHWGIKIPCDVCGFMAWNNSQLKRHKESKHDGK